MLIPVGVVKLWCAVSALQDQKTSITNFEVWIISASLVKCMDWWLSLLFSFSTLLVNLAPCLFVRQLLWKSCMIGFNSGFHVLYESKIKNTVFMMLVLVQLPQSPNAEEKFSFSWSKALSYSIVSSSLVHYLHSVISDNKITLYVINSCQV